MDSKPAADLYNERRHRIRCMKSLIVQLRADYAELNGLWESYEAGSLDYPRTEDIVRVLSFLMQGLTLLKDLGILGIEGVSWGEIGYIGKDVEDKEMRFKDSLFFEEAGYRHLQR